MNYPKLYSRNSNGSVQVWWVELVDNAYRQHYGRNDGKIVTKGWSYGEVKNAGKSNETSPNEQAKLEVEALYEKQKKKNYFEDIKEIDSGFLEPQLAKPCKDYIDDVKWEDNQIVDHKLNGIACIVVKKGGKVRAFSRKNEEFFAIPHILEALEPFFKENPDAYLQGELFNPEYVTQLNKIAELVAVTRKEKDITPELLEDSKKMVQYHIYDGYGFNKVSIDFAGNLRRLELVEAFNYYKSPYIYTITFAWCDSFDKMKKFADRYIAKGGEGVIIRNPKAPYQHKRTKDLLKYKKSESEEFEVIGFEEGEADWAGCAKAAWCKLPNGGKFKTNLRGSQAELKAVLRNQEKYIGQMITVDFQEYSPYNVPLIPYTDLLIRNYE